MKIRRLLSRPYRDPEPGVDGTGADPVVDSAPAPAPAPEATDAAAPADAPAADAPAADPAAAPAPAVDPNAPKSLLEAISASVDGKKPEPVVDPKAAPVADAKKPAEPDAAAKPKSEDLTAMPEGLAPKAQERFRALANVNKEVTAEVESLRAQTDYIGTTFKEHGITREQFEMATGLIGAMNRGDWQTVIDGFKDQMRQVALLSGKHIEGIDALSTMPDLKEKVDNLQISPEDAAEMARGRTERALQQQRAQRSHQAQREQEQTQQQEQQHERARQQAIVAVDRLCADLKSSDLDFARIEAALLPRVHELFADLPPAKWAEAFQRQYTLMKSMGAPARGNSAGTLRAGGANNPTAKPTDMFQAMFGEARP
ncbi:hypothetical protein ACSFA2_03695 [Variovorax sp. LT2P21]|uniref:hypothetical protein n=1 Tax=Variovorax sp. LT2P21 TaxID=3443731 RepID=UPI003F44DCA9